MSFINRGFFNNSPEIVAKNLLGKILVRKFSSKQSLKFRIVETEAYFGENDPASWARFGKRKDNLHMWSAPGTILIKNVHMYNMLNFVTDAENVASAVLIRALEPLDSELRCCGPGLLTKSLQIDKSFNGKNIFNCENFSIQDSTQKFEIESSKRVGVVGDLNKNLRFFIKGNNFASGNARRNI